MISRFENNLLGSREVKGLYSEESGGKELDGKGSSLELRPRERGGSKDQSEIDSADGLKQSRLKIRGRAQS